MNDGDTYFLDGAECIYVEEPRICVECDNITHYVEICFEAPFCSVECLQKWDTEYWDAVYEGVYPKAWERVMIY